MPSSTSRPPRGAPPPGLQAARPGLRATVPPSPLQEGGRGRRAGRPPPHAARRAASLRRRAAPSTRMRPPCRCCAGAPRGQRRRAGQGAPTARRRLCIPWLSAQLAAVCSEYCTRAVGISGRKTAFWHRPACAANASSSSAAPAARRGAAMAGGGCRLGQGGEGAREEQDEWAVGGVRWREYPALSAPPAAHDARSRARCRACATDP